jgi:hypothetical protein
MSLVGKAHESLSFVLIAVPAPLPTLQAAAYERYAENDRKLLIMLQQGGRMIRGSDRED